MPQTFLSLVGLLVIVFVCAGVALVGRSRERIDASALLAGASASAIVQAVSTRWDPVWALMIIDVVLLVIFVVVAWRPPAAWPIWAVGFQGLIVALHALHVAEAGARPAVYLAAVNLATCGLTGVMAYAGWAAWRRRRES